MISVCMATYNGAKYIKEQVDSILMQLSPNDELIISDDRSTDLTLEILKGYEDDRIKIIEHQKTIQKYVFGYTAANLENALKSSKGDYIFMADQDDVWLPNKVSLMMECLQKCDMVLSDCSFVDASLNVLVKSKFAFENVKMRTIRNLYKCKYLGSSMAFRRKMLKFVLPIPKNVPHDLWIGLIGQRVGKFEMLSVSTMLYRRHDNNVSATNNELLDKQKKDSNVRMTRNNNGLLFQLAYRCNAAWSLLKFVIKMTVKTK